MLDWLMLAAAIAVATRLLATGSKAGPGAPETPGCAAVLLKAHQNATAPHTPARTLASVLHVQSIVSHFPK